ncbi:MAG: phenylalanine--tRNA ligase subunit alpha [Ignavibacteria bacterium]|nr:phenylalanine--tRNA ligase subunit alpha [Ignavibacteria bacterium]
MIEKIESIKSEALNEAALIKNVDTLEQFRIKFLGRKGLVHELFEGFKDVPPQEKGRTGKALNELKQVLQEIFDSKKSELETGSAAGDDTDHTLPGRTFNKGTRHLIHQAIDEITSIFAKIGFDIYEGYELEDEFHNFDALNTPDYHPSRDMQDTFYVDSAGKDKKYLLRTHTSPGQVHVMQSNKPPIRVVVPGKVYRNEEVSSRSLAVFHQVEGLYVDKDVSFRELKGTLDYFAWEFFGKGLKTRLRPSFFPFTEPSAEMDVECILCKGEGCRVCKHTGWLEILGCGMVDPNVFKAVGYDPEEYTGFAFGMGIERTLMIKHGIPDIRIFYENDIRFLKQF